MAAVDVKAEARRLMDQRSALEKQIEVIVARLEVAGGPGVKGSLVDAEGFPRADIDIPRARADRNRLAVLHNDHKDLTSRIEALILQLHSDARATTPADSRPPASSGKDALPAASSNPSDPPTTTALGFPAAANPTSAASIPPNPDAPSASAAAPPEFSRLSPFAVIDDVASGSPGEADGLRLGDQLLQFGAVVASEGAVAASGEFVQRVARELQRAEGGEVPVVVRRAGEVVRLAVRPRQWRGRGLLGCHMQPL